MNALVTYLVGVMLAWSPASRHAPGESPDQVRARYESIAGDIAAVALDPAEPPLYAGDSGRAREALLLASIAFWESAFRKDVDDGQCRRGDCDAGGAVSIFQLHAEQGGFVLEGSSFTYANAKSADWRSENADQIHGRAVLAHDRRAAVRVALHMLRRSLRVWTVGERARRHAETWWQRRPFSG